MYESPSATVEVVFDDIFISYVKAAAKFYRSYSESKTILELEIQALNNIVEQLENNPITVKSINLSLSVLQAILSC